MIVANDDKAQGTPAPAAPAAERGAFVIPPELLPPDEGAELEAAAEPSPAAAAPPAEPAPDPATELEERAMARAQTTLNRERLRMKAELEARHKAGEQAVLAALASPDPDAALERLGVPPAQRRALAERVLLRHVPADRVTPELKRQVEDQDLRAELANIKAELGTLKQTQVQERQIMAQQAQEEEARSIFKATCEATPEAVRVAQRAKTPRGLARLEQDALALAADLSARGVISQRNTMKENARRLVLALEQDYAEEFGAAAPVAADPVGEKRTNGKAGDVAPARTITRGAGAPSRPPPPAESPRTDEDWLKAEAEEFDKKRRAGHFRSEQ